MVGKKHQHEDKPYGLIAIEKADGGVVYATKNRKMEIDNAVALKVCNGV